MSTEAETETPAEPASKPEVVEKPSTDLAKQESEANSALERAAEAALAMPGIPGRDEFLSLAMQARMLSMSGAAPVLVRDNPHLAFHVAMVGRDLGISPSAALELIDVIETKNGPRLSLSPQLLNGQIRRLGLGSIVPIVQTTSRCVAAALGPHGTVDVRCKATWPIHVDDCGCRDVLGESEFTWEDAQMAGLAAKACQPGDHKDSCKCNFGYRSYPKRMLWWRASGFCADDFFPEAGLGLYTAEELGAMVDADGRALDVASVELPPGYEPPPPPPETEKADPDELWTLQLRLHALPDVQRAELRKSWTGRKLPAAGLLDAAGYRLANAMLNGAEASARSTGWKADAALVEAAARVAPCVAVALGFPPGSPEPAPAPQDEPPAPSGDGDGAKPATAAPGAVQAPVSGPVYEQIPDDADPAGLEGAEPYVDETIERVKSMNAHDVDKELTRLKQHTEGKVNDRRRRLAVALLREKLDAIASAAKTE